MDTRNPLMGPLGMSLAAVLIVLFVLLFELPQLVTSAGTAVGAGAPDRDPISPLITEHELAMTADRERFIGRSFFFRPPDPPRPKPVYTPPPAPKAPTPPPPPPVNPTPPAPKYPKTYVGPDLTAIIGATAIFKPASGTSDMIVINVGETRKDIELLGTSPPRTVEVKYKGGGPYEVTLFEMKMPDFTSNESDLDSAEDGIVVDERDADDTDTELLEGEGGWPAGTIAGDPVRVIYRQGPYEASIRGTLTRANDAWLVVDVDRYDYPIEIFKADILSVQNLKPKPPEPDPEPEPEDEPAATATNTNASMTPANDNATIAGGNENATAANLNASGLAPVNDNATSIELPSSNDNATATAGNTNASTPAVTAPEEPGTETPAAAEPDDASGTTEPATPQTPPTTPPADG
ncbi:MAG: hypothetical protein MK116_06710 [Phycisphaerales bacterium]|nr:hypothetical protein [Phycisphaerales bacterium]